MQSETANSNDIIDLDAYRTGRRRVSIHIQEARPAPKDAEDALNEIARHLLMAIRVITARKN